MTKKNMLTKQQREEINSIEASSTFRLMKGTQRLSEFVSWVFVWMPVIAPLPNLFSLLFAIASHMGGKWYHYIPAAVICISLEALLIGVSEQLNGVLDRQLRTSNDYKKKYNIPLGLSFLGALAIVGVLLGLVFFYEVKGTGNYTLMTLPLISVLSIMFMGIRSYMDVVEGVRQDIDSRQLTDQQSSMQSSIDSQSALIDQLTDTVNQLQIDGSQKDAEIRQLTGILREERDKLHTMEIDNARLDATVKVTSQSTINQSSSRQKLTTDDRQEIIISEMQKSPDSAAIIAALQRATGAGSPNTIKKDLRKLADEGRVVEDGKKWYLRMSEQVTIPSIEVHTNGHAPERI